jgi:hypothetical protein
MWGVIVHCVDRSTKDYTIQLNEIDVINIITMFGISWWKDIIYIAEYKLKGSG